MNKQMKIFTNGFIRENPLLVLNIGLCSSLGVTTSIFNGLGMGMGMMFVLLMSEIVISIFRKLIPSAIRLPVFIIIIAAFTTIVQLVLQAFVQPLYDALGVFLPLIVVNCIIMGRVEAFASKNNIGNSILDALGMGIGYTLVLVIISLIRELFGAGTITIWTGLSVTVIPEAYRIGILNSAPGGFLVFGFLAAIVQGIKAAKANKKGEKIDIPEPGCEGCSTASTCASKGNPSENATCPVVEKTVEKATAAAKEQLAKNTPSTNESEETK